MKDLNVNLYSNPGVSYLDLRIQNDCAELISEIRSDDGDDFEVHYILNEEETKKLLSLITLEEFIEFARKEKTLLTILKFLDANNIIYKKIGY